MWMDRRVECALRAGRGTAALACKAGGLAAKSPNCPTCRAPLVVSREEEFKRFWKLVHDRSPGRHTPLVQNQLGSMYEKGEGVKQDTKVALKWYRKAAEQGVAVQPWCLLPQWQRRSARLCQGFAVVSVGSRARTRSCSQSPQHYAATQPHSTTTTRHRRHNSLADLCSWQQVQ